MPDSRKTALSHISPATLGSALSIDDRDYVYVIEFSYYLRVLSM